MQTKLNGTWLQHYSETLNDHLKLAHKTKSLLSQCFHLLSTWQPSMMLESLSLSLSQTWLFPKTSTRSPLATLQTLISMPCPKSTCMLLISKNIRIKSYKLLETMKMEIKSY